MHWGLRAGGGPRAIALVDRRCDRVGGDSLLDGFHRLLGDLFGELVQVGRAGLVDELEAGFFGHEHVEQQAEDAVARERPRVPI